MVGNFRHRLARSICYTVVYKQNKSKNRCCPVKDTPTSGWLRPAWNLASLKAPWFLMALSRVPPAQYCITKLTWSDGLCQKNVEQSQSTRVAVWCQADRDSSCSAYYRTMTYGMPHLAYSLPWPTGAPNLLGVLVDIEEPSNVRMLQGQVDHRLVLQLLQFFLGWGGPKMSKVGEFLLGQLEHAWNSPTKKGKFLESCRSSWSASRISQKS